MRIMFGHRRTICRIVAAVIALNFVGCSSRSSNVTADPAALDKIYTPSLTRPYDLVGLVDSLTKPLIDDGTATGMVVGILNADGSKDVFGYGRKSPTSNAPPDGDTIFAIGSLTKSFTSVLLHDLANQGVVRLSDTVADIWPAQPNLSQAAKRVTLQQLVNHASGFPRQPNDLAMLGSLIHYSITGNNIYRDLNQAEVLKFLSTFDPSASDIGSYHYSNLGMVLLGELLETRTGDSITMMLDEHYITPLALHDTDYVVPPMKMPRLATGHVGDSPFFVARGTAIQPADTDDSMKGLSGLYSSTNDLLKFAQYRLSMHDMPIIKLNDSSATSGYKKLSFGWEVDDFDDGTEIISQHGMIAGYSAYMGIEPKKNIAVVVLYNDFNWDDHVGHNLLHTLARSEKAVITSPENNSPPIVIE